MTQENSKRLKALSIRQPWINAILYGGKRIENREWNTNRREWFLIHASSKMTKKEQSDFVAFCNERGLEESLNKIFELGTPPKMGGIVGLAQLTNVVTHSESPWFTGTYGFEINNIIPINFIPCKGSLGFFTPDISEENWIKIYGERWKFLLNR